MMHRIRHVEPVADHRVVLTWEDGVLSDLDMRPVIAQGGVFAPLERRDVFTTVRVGDRGRSIVWTDPDGEEIDFCADALWQQTRLKATPGEAA